MRLGGLALLVERGVDVLGDPRAARYRQAIVLGALREDVAWVPGLGAVEHLSLGHFHRPGRPGGFVRFVPGARFWIEHHLAAAVRAHRRGRAARGFVRLGHAAHLLADMACPVHVHARVHAGDRYEWYVEAHADELGALPVPAPPVAARAAALVESLARFTARFPADATQSPHGRVLRRLGLRRPVPTAEVARAARAIVPVAIAHMAALIGLYLARTDGHA